MEGLRDRSSRPHSPPSQTPLATCTAVEALRCQRHTGKQIAAEVAVSPAPLAASCVAWDQTGYAISSRPSQNAAMNAKTPGEIIHIDIKKLGRVERVGYRITGDPSGPNKSRGAGWDFVHVCIDDHSRVAFSEINRTRRRTALFPFSRLLWLITKVSASASLAS